MFTICLSYLLIIFCWLLLTKNHSILSKSAISLLIIILTKNHDLFLAFDNHCQIAEHSINQSIESAHSTIMSMLTISQCQLLQTTLSIHQFIKQSAYFFLSVKFSLHYFFLLENFDLIYFCVSRFWPDLTL